MDISNDVVWAKIKYSPFWPARIVKPPPGLPKIPPKKFCVLFFGTHDYGYPSIDDVKSYHKHRLKYCSKTGRGVKFQNAVKECDGFVNDPSNFCAIEPDTIILKQEANQIKKEDEDHPYVRKVIERKNICLECQAKDNQIAISKSELDQMRFELAEHKKCQNREEKNEYEVQAIIGHGVSEGRQYFHIRWKGYTADSDTWETRDNLHCDLILKRYLKKNNMT